MKEVAERLSVSAKHLSLVDEICEEVDAQYAAVKSQLRSLPGYEAIAKQLYHGQKGRQMVLGDLLTYILAGRGYWSVKGPREAFQNYVQVIMQSVNLVLMQETILSSGVDQRQQFLRRLAQEQISGFFADEEEERDYRRLLESKDQIRPGHPLYKTMDSLLPKSMGVAIELLVFAYLLKRQVGYIVPLLFTQRLFRGSGSLAPPDYLLLRPGGEVLGVEVGGGLGIYGTPSRGKLDQVNRFVQDTSIPVVTATMPHMQYRCPECLTWPLFCPEVIEKVSDGWDGSLEFVSCVECNRFGGGSCPFVLFRGKIEPRRDDAHYHYGHLQNQDYVSARALRTEADRRKKLRSYYPFVQGLERIPRVGE